MRYLLYTFIAFLAIPTTHLFAQYVPGQIIRACASPTGKNILDPDNATDGSANDFTSKTSAGFGTGSTPDVTNSELPFKPLPPFSLEPYSDLRRGPNHMYSDFVPDANGAAYYMYTDGTNLLFRMRMGSIIPGAKGYSLLFDTDGKFGATGANADPNFIAATTGTGGNPGFEIEIVLCTGGTNNGIQVYNVDGREAPGTAIHSLTNWLNYSQISIASTSDNGDPDFLLDFYVPLTVFTAAPLSLNLATTPLRVIPTTVMSPQGAIGGPKSDIYGLDDTKYPNPNVEYETLLGAQPGILVSAWGGSSTTSPVTQCTAPPAITSSVSVGNNTITGTWSKSSLTGAEQNTTTIRVYRIPSGSSTATLVATVNNVASGATWTTHPTAITLAANDIIYATAIATNESECLKSNSVKVPPACNSTNSPVKPILATCSDFTKGFSGTNFPGAGFTIHFEGLTTTADNATSTANTGSGGFEFSTATSWTFRRGCNGGSNIGKDIYKLYYRNTATGCQSEPVYICVPGTGNGSLASTNLVAPVIVSQLTPGATTISGTATAGATVLLAINGVELASTMATGGNYSFSNLALIQNDAVVVTSYNTTSTCPTTANGTVNCRTRTPLFTTNTAGTLTVGAPISGTSSEPTGTVIRIYNSANTLLATTTVKSNGTWSTGNSPETTPATINAAANTTYYATAQNGTCNVSTATGNLTTASGTTTGRCAAATITTSPLNSSVTTLGGAIGNSATAAVINVYEDGYLIGTTSTLTSVNTWSLSGLTLYAGDGSTTGKITLGVKEGTKEEEACSNAYNVLPAGCSTPTAGSTSISPSGPQTVSSGQTITFSFQTPTTGVFYSIVDQSSGAELGTGVWSTGTNFNIVTKPLSSSTTAVVKGANMTSSGESCSGVIASRALTVLPIHITDFTGSRKDDKNYLTWITSYESDASHFEVERSLDGTNFTRIGHVAVKGSGTTYYFTDGDAAAPVQYYRLKLVDNNGSFKYSAIIQIRSASPQVGITLYPNPVQANSVIEISVPYPQSVKLQIVDMQGRVVQNRNISLAKGRHAILLHSSSLTNGEYILRAWVDKQWEHVRFRK